MLMDWSLGVHPSAPDCKLYDSCYVGKILLHWNSSGMQQRLGTSAVWLRLLDGWNLALSSKMYSTCSFDKQLAWYYLRPCGISAGLAGIQVLMSVCLTICLINGSPDFTCLAEKMCIATEGMESKWVKWNIHWRMLIDDFIMWEQKWPEKARVMMYCLTIHWSGMWIQTAAFISPHLYARECSCEWAQFGVSAGAGRLMSPDMMYALSSCSLSITRHPQHG